MECTPKSSISFEYNKSKNLILSIGFSPHRGNLKEVSEKGYQN
jgi:hypothetical protein